MNKNRVTPNNITTLSDNEIFVFGSNLQGEHVGGAALVALKQFGAENGKGVGLHGKSWALPTCKRVDKFTTSGVKVRVTEPLTLNEIATFVRMLWMDAHGMNKDKTFYVTKVGCGIAGFEVRDIAPLFRHLADLKNVYLPIEFLETYEK